MNAFPTDVRRSPASLADYQAAGLDISRHGLFDPTARPESSIHDFTTLRGRPGGKAGATNPVAGVKMLNMVNGKGDAENVGQPGPTYSNGAIRFDANVTSRSIRLSSSPRKSNMLIGAWYRSTGVRTASDNNRLFGIGGLFNTVLVADKIGGPCTQFQAPMAGGNAIIDSAALRSSFSDGQLHFLAMTNLSSAGGKHRAVLILDGIRLPEGGDWTNDASGAGDATIGTPDAVGTIIGGFYRTIVEDLDASGMTIEQVSAQELRHRDHIESLG